MRSPHRKSAVANRSHDGGSEAAIALLRDAIGCHGSTDQELPEDMTDLAKLSKIADQILQVRGSRGISPVSSLQ